MKILMKSSLLLTPVLLAGTIFAQSSGAPLYPADPHPAQVPNTGQDQAPTEMNQGTGQNEPGQTQPGQNLPNDMPVFR